MLLNTDLVWMKEKKESVFMHKRNYGVEGFLSCEPGNL